MVNDPTSGPTNDPVWLADVLGRLGWRANRRRHTCDDDGSVVEWFEAKTPLHRVWLHVGTMPSYFAGVYALPMQVWTGAHWLRPGNSTADEAERLAPMFNRRWFESVGNVRRFRRLWPEATGWTWPRVRRQPGLIRGSVCGVARPFLAWEFRREYGEWRLRIPLDRIQDEPCASGDGVIERAVLLHDESPRVIMRASAPFRIESEDGEHFEAWHQEECDGRLGPRRRHFGVSPTQVREFVERHLSLEASFWSPMRLLVPADE